MKEYKIELSEDKNLIGSTGETLDELGLALQVWQDLNRMDQKGFMEQEDLFIKKILAQILEKEFNGVGGIPVPSYYETDIEKITPTD